MLVHPDGTREPLAIGLPGDREVDEKRLGAQVEPAEVEAFDEADFAANPALAKGYIGPGVLGDREGVAASATCSTPGSARAPRWVTGADEPGRHVIDLVAGRDFTADGTIEAAEVRDGDACPACGARRLETARGIEMGHIFQLGTQVRRGARPEGARRERQAASPSPWAPTASASRRAVAASPRATTTSSAWSGRASSAPADVHVVATGKDEAVFDLGRGAHRASSRRAACSVLLRRPPQGQPRA